MSRRTQGFSLLEMSVVLGIIAVVLVFGISIADTALRGNDRLINTSRLEAIQRALDGYAAVNGHLPCPSSRSLVPANGNFGVEARDSASYTTDPCVLDGAALSKAGISNIVYFGALPVRTLGLPDSYAVDAWNNKFTYAVSARHVYGVGSYAYYSGPITVYSGDRTGVSYPITTRFTNTGANPPGAGATYVVISHGADGKGAYPLHGTAPAVACGVSVSSDVENCDEDDLNFYDSPFNDGDNPITFFDDYVIWGSNMLDRMPSSNGGEGAGCTSGCALWCARCDENYPPLNSPSVICRRTITQTSPCTALCEYAYPTENIPCP